MSPVIEVLISVQGEAVLQTKGYAGGECLKATAFLERALGLVVSEHKTAEFHHAQAAEHHVRQ